MGVCVTFPVSMSVCRRKAWIAGAESQVSETVGKLSVTTREGAVPAWKVTVGSGWMVGGVVSATVTVDSVRFAASSGSETASVTTFAPSGKTVVAFGPVPATNIESCEFAGD